MRILLLIALMFFLSSSTVSLFAQCEGILENFSHESFGEPVLKGTAVLIPEINLKITKRETSELISLQTIRLRYVWEHYLVQYKTLKDGWRNSYDIIACKTNADGMVHFPEYNLVPRGWYDGPELGKRLPRFLEIELSIENHHFWITKDQIKKIRDKKVKKPIELKRPDKYVPPIKVEIIP